ncbi:MAG: VWA domain-containing protein [Deltaproteobacteria bacterium]|nr:VWA domain-containing protein [Deltaproteobacteria bacterium]
MASCSANDDRDHTGNGTTDDDSDTSTDDGADSDSDDTDDTDDLDGGDPEQICQEENFKIEIVPARMMVLLDGSPSMAEDNKWSTATSAITGMVTTWAGKINFGFDVFPGSGNCDVAAPVVMDVDVTGSAAVIGMMPGGPTGGSTPLYCGIANFLEHQYAPIFSSTEADSYLVVVSDGADLCGKGCCVNPFSPDCRLPGNSAPVFAALATELLNGDNPIMTFAIGLSGENPEDLNALANNGGTGYAQYFDAQDPTILNSVFGEIAEQALSCTYNFGDIEDGADRNQINVYFGDDIIGYDEDCTKSQGWDWVDDDHTEIIFCDQACETLKSGAVEDVRATFGCTTVVV